MKKIIFSLFLLILTCCSSFAQHDYAKAQYLSTYFLGGQRCGATNSWLHGACHTTDGQPVGKDLTGGWHDCGDYIKFHVTAPYAALAYLYGYDKFTAAYADDYSQANSAPPANGIPDVLDEVKIQTDYLIKCVDGSTIYWQVGGMAGHGEDHNSFNEPVSNSEELLYNGSKIRPVRSATSGHSNAFGDAAAALALMSIAYQPFDAGYAANCLTAAQAYYTAGKINENGTADYDNLAYSFMGSSETDDNMGMAAAMLYRATSTASYLTEAENYASGLGAWDDFSYATLNSLLFMELYHLTSNVTYLNKVGNLVNGYSNASCGYYHNTNWGSLRDAGNAALIAALYHQETNNASTYSFAKSNIDFILGTHGYISADAPANMSFLIGYNELGGSYPQHPHHGAAFGKSSNAWTLYTQEKNNPGTVNFEYELKGGLAGGPESSCSNFTDNIDNYVSSEYCTYYNAAFTGAVAYINQVENALVTSVTDQNDHKIEIFPNPTSEIFVIDTEKGLDFNLVDVTGKIVHSFTTAQKTQIDVSSFKPGVYFLNGVNNSIHKSIVIN